MTNEQNPLMGYWVLAACTKSSHEIGVTYLRFTKDGLTQEGYENEWRIHVLSFQYWIEGDLIATICPPNTRIELSKFSISPTAELTLSLGNDESTWIRAEKQAFFESTNIWNPGILFNQQVDYMSLLDTEPYSHQIDRANVLGISPQALVHTNALWQCWKYGRGRFASFHLEDFDQILARGVLIDDEDNEDRTLLSYLAEDGNTEAVQRAVEYGADINHNDLYQLTALDYATLGNRYETARVLKTLGGIHGAGWSEIGEIG